LDDRVERLRGIPLFAKLDDEALERVAAIATETEFPGTRGARALRR
jgi:hypothetical protein